MGTTIYFLYPSAGQPTLKVGHSTEQNGTHLGYFTVTLAIVARGVLHVLPVCKG